MTFDREAYAISYDLNDEKRQWETKEERWPYGSCWWVPSPNMVQYTDEHLKKWTTREIMKMAYYLVKRMDGYGHLSASEAVKHNAEAFTAALHQRGFDPICNARDNMLYFYNWGYRSWVYTEHRLGHTKQECNIARNRRFPTRLI